MSETDLYRSNGTCFFGPGQIANTSFIPCGNAALSGTQACCYEGDFCVGDGACWDEDSKCPTSDFRLCLPGYTHVSRPIYTCPWSCRRQQHKFPLTDHRPTQPS